MSSIRASAGFTLIEILVAVSLISMITLAATAMMFASMKGALKADAINIVRETGDNALVALEREIRQAVSIGTCDGGSSFTFQAKRDGQTKTVIIHQAPYNNNQAIQVCVESCDPNTGEDQRFITSAETNVLVEGTGLAFSCTGNRVLVTFPLQYKPSGGDATSGFTPDQFELYVTMRNFQN